MTPATLVAELQANATVLGSTTSGRWVRLAADHEEHAGDENPTPDTGACAG